MSTSRPDVQMAPVFLAEREPELFDEKDIPVRHDVLGAIKAKHYEHTGQRLADNETLALRLVELLSAGWGVKRIAAELSISPHTIRAARRELDRQGKLAPLKQRLVDALSDALEAGVSQYRDALEGGLISPGQLPVGLGIIFDKRALALGEPTAISVAGTAALRPQDLSVQALQKFFEIRPADNESIGLPPIPQQIAPSSPVVATSVATPPTPTPVPGSAPIAEPHPTRPAPEAGGGDPRAPAPSP